MNNYCVLILSNGRPSNVKTISALDKHGYTGEWFIVCDDNDSTLTEYQAKYGDRVKVFSKESIAETFDEGDNFKDRRAIVYARNASFDIAEQLGYRYFFQFDDDYTGFRYRFDTNRKYTNKPVHNLNAIFKLMFDFYKSTPFKSIAMGQGGDYLGGSESGTVKSIKTFRKAMNSFLCDTEDRFTFIGRINEDVNTYTRNQSLGELFITLLNVSLEQVTTQSNSGGMTDLYKDSGTYVKSFYSVMYSPSSVRITGMKSANSRLHHAIKWNNTAPKIIREEIKEK